MVGDHATRRFSSDPIHLGGVRIQAPHPLSKPVHQHPRWEFLGISTGKGEKNEICKQICRERAYDAYFEFTESSHLQATCSQQPLAATCSHLNSHLPRNQIPTSSRSTFHGGIINILPWKAPGNSQHSPAEGTGELSTFSGGRHQWSFTIFQVAASSSSSGCSSGCK